MRIKLRSKAGVLISIGTLLLIGVLLFAYKQFKIIGRFDLGDKAPEKVKLGSENNNEKDTELDFIFLGDTGTGNENQYNVGKSIKGYCEGIKCEAMLIVGDVIYERGVTSLNDSGFQSKFEKPYEGIDLPIYIAFGNHDYLGCKDCYLQYGAISKKWRMPSRYYSISKDDLLDIFVIDTENFDAGQQDWLKKSLSESKAKHKIVSGHRPLLTFEEAHKDEKWDGKDQLKEIICNNAEVYVAAHSHILEDNGKIEGCKVEQLVTGAGGASLRKIIPNGVSKFNYYGYGFVSLKIGENGVRWEFVDDKAKVLYQREVNE
jgi:acid phosphatase